MSTSPRVPLAVAGVLLLASTVPAVRFFTDPRPFSEVASGGVHLALYALTLAGMLALLVAVPRLGNLVGPAGGRLPGWLVTLSLVATALNAATHFVQVFVAPYLADVAPAALDDQGGGLMVGMVASWVAFLVAWVCVGVIAFRRRLLPRPSAALLAGGALVLPAIGPLAGLPLGLALVLAARPATPRVGESNPSETAPVMVRPSAS